jgi:hypothetical protein
VKTDELIRTFTADGMRPVVSIERWLGRALLAGISLSAALFLAMLHARPDIAAAVHTPAFCFKVVVALSLAATGAFLLSDAARPTPHIRWRGLLLLAPALLAAGTLYALTCPDDSALFVATWYSIAIIAVTATTACVGPRILRW